MAICEANVGESVEAGLCMARYEPHSMKTAERGFRKAHIAFHVKSTSYKQCKNRRKLVFLGLIIKI